MSHHADWTPPSWMFRGERPESDSFYFENLTRCIFQAGLNWSVIANKWPNFQKAFDGFSTSKVAKYGEADINRLLNDTGIVRNERKIIATISNAREFEKLRENFGSFQEWLDSMDKSNNYNSVVKRLQSTLRHVGPSTAHIFLYSVGEDIKYDESVHGRRAPTRTA